MSNSDPELALLRSVIEVLPDGILVLDSEERVIAWNERFREMWEMPESLFETRENGKLIEFAALRTVRPEEFLDQTMEYHVRKKEDYFDVVELKDGRLFERYSTPRKAGETVNRVVSFRDITERVRFQDSLKASEERFRAIFENATFGLTLFGMNGEFLACNPALCRMLGYSEAEMKTLSIADISDPATFSDANQGLLSAMADGEIDRFEIEKRYRKKDGSTMWGHLVSSLIRDGEEKPLYGVGMVIDISRQKKIEEELRVSEDRFRRVFETAPAGIAMGDLRGGFIACNPAICRILGYTEEELLQIGIPGVTTELSEETAELIRKLRKGELDEIALEGYFRRKDGKRLWLSVRVSTVRSGNGNALFSVMACNDLTDRKEAEEEVRNALRLRDEFIAVASHELRTPITPLRLQNHLLRRHLASERFAGYSQAPQILRMIDISEQQLDHLVQLIEDMLNASRISAGRMELEIQETNLSELVGGAVDRHREEFRKAGCELELEIHPEIRVSCDISRISQVISNLLTNAAKYGRGEPVRVELKREDERARLSVRDGGIGIAKQDHSKIFEQFERVAPVNAYGGFGLGLYIVRQIVHAHGGSIRVESELGQGAEFIVEFPGALPAQ